jgi:electron transfer flavoprotein beta subunit
VALNIVCCVKQVLDPEMPASAFAVDEAAKRVVPVAGIAPVISQFDHVAVEAALRLRESEGDGAVTILTLGPDRARDVIRTALAMGADEGVHLNDPALFDGDAIATARALKAAIDKLGDVDIVLCGRQATDFDQGATGPALAELMGVPSATVVRSVSHAAGRVQAQRIVEDGFETVELPMPCLLTVASELAEPRYPKLPQVLAAARKELTVWTAADLGLDQDVTGLEGSRLVLERLYVPAIENRCEFIEGDGPQQMAANLARTLREAKLI